MLKIARESKKKEDNMADCFEEEIAVIADLYEKKILNSYAKQEDHVVILLFVFHGSIAKPTISFEHIEAYLLSSSRCAEVRLVFQFSSKLSFNMLTCFAISYVAFSSVVNKNYTRQLYIFIKLHVLCSVVVRMKLYSVAFL